MSRLIKMLVISVFACVCQTNLVQHIRIAGVAPDLIIATLVVLTTYSGAYGGFCTGALTAMLYDASVGYVLAINLVGYTFIGWMAAMMRSFFNVKLKKLKHKSYVVMMVICFVLTLMREILYIGYLFLIGSEQSMITIVRALLCSGYSAVMVLPMIYVMRRIMNWRLSSRKKNSDDLKDESIASNNAV